MSWATLLACCVLGATAYRLPVPPPRAHAARRAAAPLLCDDELSWQEELEKVLSPDTAQSDREVLLKDLLGRGPEIAQEVTEAISSGSFATLLPDGGKKNELMDDLSAVQRQLVEDILPGAQSLLDPTTLQETVARAASEGPGLAQEAASSAPVAVTTLLQDPARAFTMAQQEARNVFTRTPEGLETPSYTVIGQGEGYELRSYPSYGVAVTPLAVKWDPPAIALGFNALIAYVLGANQRSEGMDMTTPLRVDVLASGAAEMAFPLTSKYSAATAPAPSDGRVSLRQAEAQTVAVREFTGYATEGEVGRQLSTLLSQLRREALDVVDESAYSVFQYNPPYTLPWLRRNELAVPLNLEAAGSAEAEAAPEAEASAEVAEVVDEESSEGAELADASPTDGDGLEYEDDGAPSD